VPGYLKKEWGEERWSRIARFRLGNEIEERKREKRNHVGYVEEERWRHGNTFGRDVENGW